MKEQIGNKNKALFVTLLAVNIFFGALLFYLDINLIHIFITLIFLSLMIYLCCTKNMKFENIFLFITIPFGLMFIFLLPPTQGPDEIVHLIRSYDLSRGRILYQGNNESGILPSSIGIYFNKVGHIRIVRNPNEKVIMSDFDEAKKISLNKNDTSYYKAEKTESYMSLAYLPQSIGIFIGDFLNLPIHYILLLGRITNFIVWTIICYLSLKIMPIKKELMMFVMLIPICLQQGLTFSPDALLNSCSFLLLAYIMNLKFKKEKILIKDILILLIISIGIVSVKLPYLILSLLILTISKDKFGEKGLIKRFNSFFIILIVGFSIFGAWTIMSRPVNIEANSLTEMENNSNLKGEMSKKKSEEVKKTAGYIETFKEIIQHPVEFSKRIYYTLRVNLRYYLETFIAKFGWLDTQVPTVLILLGTISLILITLNGEKDFNITLWDRTIYLFIGLGLSLLLFILAFKWEGADYNNVMILPGIQGRYFYPFIIPLLMSFSQNKNYLDLKKYSWIVPSISILMLSICVNMLIFRYWI